MILKKWLYGLPMPIYFLLLVLLLYLLPGFWLSVCRAQSSTPPGTALAVGQPVPDITIPNVINHPNTTVRLSDYRGKLLLLEFWAPWCGTCKATMPKMAAIQEQFPGQVQVLLSTTEDRSKVETFFSKWTAPDGTPYRLPSTVNDTTLKKLFPYRLVPHIVWISPAGNVHAITTAAHVTPENVRRALSGSELPARVKRDIDLQLPLFTTSDLPTEHLRHYTLLLKGKIDGLPSGAQVRRHNGTVVGRVHTNKPLLSLYTSVALHYIPDYTEHRLILEVKDEGSLRREKSSLPEEEWRRRHLYSYEQVSPEADDAAYYARMLADLNQFTDFEGSIEPRTVPCLALVLTGNPRKLRTKGGKTKSTLHLPGPRYLRNAPVSYLINRLLGEPGIRVPVLDETGYTGHIDLELTASLGDLPALRKELRRYHLDLVPVEREINMLIIRDRQTAHVQPRPAGKAIPE